MSIFSGQPPAMNKYFALLISTLILSFCVRANDYEKAWDALRNNDRKKAMELLRKAINDPNTAVDAYATYLFVQQFEIQEAENGDFLNMLRKSKVDANPYLFALWFNDNVLGSYGRKTAKYQLDLLDELGNKTNFHGSLKAAAHYFLGYHYLSSGKFDQSRKEWARIASVDQWQFVGPFDNLSGSGFHKSYGVLENPKPESVFRSLNNAPIQWFKPATLNPEGWQFTNNYVKSGTALVYAQSFVYSPVDQRLVLNVGANGSIKVWVNDALMIAESEERVTELDAFKSFVQLKKGYNRVLVQIGFTANSGSNFIVRFSDEKGYPVDGLKADATYQTYTADKTQKPQPIPLFAETFFENKIKEQPKNLVNYILLTQTYLRNKKATQARETIEKALEIQPDNSILRFELVQSLLKSNNRTLLSQQVEWFREHDTASYFSQQFSLERLKDEEKYEDAMQVVQNMESRFGLTEDIWVEKISLLGSLEKYDQLVEEIQAAYKKFPTNSQLMGMMFRLHKNAYKDNKAAAKVYEKYLEDNFTYSTYKNLAEDYIEQGKKDKGEDMLKKLEKEFPFDPELLTDMVSYYYKQQNYSKAFDYTLKALAQAPYTTGYWENKAVVEKELGKKNDAIESYRKSLFYDSKRYEARQKLRALEGKEDLYKALPTTDLYAVVKESANKPIDEDHSYAYLLDEKQLLIHNEGAVEEFHTLVIRILTESGIDDWKESYIPYNSNTQSLLIEKAEVVKKNGSKLTAEISGNEFVFTSLEAGDAVLIRYRIQDFSRGRLAREHWDRFQFSSFNPCYLSRYTVLVDKTVKYKLELLNGQIQPQKKDFGDYEMFTWEMGDIKPVKSEPFMPALSDVGLTLHMSTIKSWEDISQWYSDLSYIETENDYEVNAAYREIFPGKETLTDLQKARRIYDYIERNIRYSHVSFRQGAYVPQKPDVTLNTRLGDCKDLSALFVSLARKAGLNANMLLVATKDNGMKDMTLPSVEFDHCIAYLSTGGKEYYIELTDNDLPFASLPNNVQGAPSLLIPYFNEKSTGSTLKLIDAKTRTSDKIRRQIDLKVSDNDLDITAKVQFTGSLTSGVRSTYSDLGAEKTREEMQENLSGSFKNPLKLEWVKMGDLKELTDSVSYEYKATVANEIVEVGEMQMFKIPFGDMVATMDNFSRDERVFPIEYWRYENVDTYETTVNIQLPAGKQWVEVPASQTISFGKSTYSLKFEKRANGQLTITRKAVLDRGDIAAKDYATFKAFMNNIVKAEGKFVAFK